MKKAGRNDPCPCGSGKKFKKCCESEMLGGRFKATHPDSTSAPQIQKTMGMIALFQSYLAATPKKPLPPEPAPIPPETAPSEPPVQLEGKAETLLT